MMWTCRFDFACMLCNYYGMASEVLTPCRVQVLLSEGQVRRLIDCARRKEQSRSEYIRAALLVALAKDEKEGNK